LIDFIYISFIGISLIVGLFFLKKTSPLWYLLLLVFLAVTLVNEITCYFFKKEMVNTIANYNIYYYFRFPILGFIYFDAMKRNRISNYLSKVFIFISLFFLAINIYNYHTFYKLHTNYLLAGGLFIIIFSLVYLYNLIRSDLLTNPLITPFFWISIGFLFYFLGILPSLGVIKILAKKSMAIASQQLVISKSLSIVLYSLISFGFYLQWKQTK
jgi:hypothetical protein